MVANKIRKIDYMANSINFDAVRENEIFQIQVAGPSVGSSVFSAGGFCPYTQVLRCCQSNDPVVGQYSKSKALTSWNTRVDSYP